VKVLADTHTLVWALRTPDLLSSPARAAMDAGEVMASVASLWELCLKCRKKDSLVLVPIAWWSQYVTNSGIRTLPIRVSDIAALCSLPEIHKDPFDRILVAQSMAEAIPLITKDAALTQYGISTIW